MATAYSFPPPLDASGQTVGIIELGGGYAPVVKKFLQSLGLALPSITAVPVTGNNTPVGDLANPSADDLEVTLE